jgi:hypothetical protein
MVLAGCAGAGGIPADVRETPITGAASSRPGWTSVDYPEEYAARGPGLVVQLIEHLGSEHGDDLDPVPLAASRREALLMLTAQLAADLEVEQAIPFLVAELERILPDDDTLLGQCLIAKLVDLTEIEEGYRYHRRWFDEEVQAEALADLKQWMRQAGS